MKDSELWDLTCVDVTTLESTHYFFSRNILDLPSSSPVIYSHWLRAEHVPWRKRKPGFRTLTPICQAASRLPKLTTTCTLFSTQSTGYGHFKYSSDNSTMNWVWATPGPKLVWDSWRIRNAAKWVTHSHSFQISRVYPCINEDQQKDLCVSHTTSSSLPSASELRVNIDSSRL